MEGSACEGGAGTVSGRGLVAKVPCSPGINTGVTQAGAPAPLGPLSRFPTRLRRQCLFQRTNVAGPPSCPPPVPTPQHGVPITAPHTLRDTHNPSSALLSPRAKPSSGDSGAP